MKDLKELDKKAGINTDNVMKNVKDGTELIGNGDSKEQTVSLCHLF